MPRSKVMVSGTVGSAAMAKDPRVKKYANDAEMSGRDFMIGENGGEAKDIAQACKTINGVSKDGARDHMAGLGVRPIALRSRRAGVRVLASIA